MEGIRGKILTSFFIVIAVLVISGGFFVIMNFVVINSYEKTMNNLLSEYELIETTQSLTESFNNLIKYINNKERLTEFTETRSDLQNLLIELDNSIVDRESFAIYLGLRNTIKSLIDDCDAGLNSVIVGDYGNVTMYFNLVNEKNNFIKENTSRLLLKELEYLKSVKSNLYLIKQLIQFTALALFLLMIFFSIFYALKFSDNLIHPLKKLTSLADSVKKGNLDIFIGKEFLKEKDEISSLAISFGSMVHSLKNNILKLRQYLDAAGILVMTFDLDGHVLSLNRKGAEILGITEKEIFTKNWINIFVIESDRKKTKDFLNITLSEISFKDNLENIIINSQGEEKNMVWRFRTLRDSDNRLQSILATGVDVTELNRAKVTINQLKELDKLKNEVLNIATHELKTPLISIVGLSEVIKNKPAGLSPEYLEYISIINSEGQKLSRLIKSMMAVNRNELGKITVNNEDMSLSQLLDFLQPPLEMLVKRSSSNLIIENKIGDVKIISDKERISQVVYNFVDNAVKYGPHGQNIKLEIDAEGSSEIKFSVIDQGQGISEELQKKLFIKFSQLEPSLSRSQDGMGLGLYICKQNIEALGGRIGVESKNGQGSTFFFIIPFSNNSENQPTNTLSNSKKLLVSVKKDKSKTLVKSKKSLTKNK